MSVAYNYSVNWVNRDNLAPGTPAKTASAADIEAELIAIRASFQLAAATVNESHTGNTSFENVSISGNSTLGNATATSATVGAFTMEIDGVDLVISHGGSPIFRLTSTGDLSVDGDVAGFAAT